MATSAQTFLTRPLANSAILHCHEWKCAVTRLPAAARPCFCASTKPGLAKGKAATTKEEFDRATFDLEELLSVTNEGNGYHGEFHDEWKVMEVRSIIQERV